MNLRDMARGQCCVAIKYCAGCVTFLPVGAFTANKSSPDGLYSLCRDCKTARAKKYYSANRDRIVAHVVQYQRTAAGKKKLARNIKSYWTRHPQKRAAHDAVREAKRRGDLKAEPCEVCGSLKAQAHHDDYSKPLTVRWLCVRHHKEWHRAHPETS